MRRPTEKQIDTLVNRLLRATWHKTTKLTDRDVEILMYTMEFVYLEGYPCLLELSPLTQGSEKVIGLSIRGVLVPVDHYVWLLLTAKFAPLWDDLMKMKKELHKVELKHLKQMRLPR